MARFERATPCLGGRCSIQLSYIRNNKYYSKNLYLVQLKNFILYSGWQYQASSASQPPFFRLIRKAVWGTMATSNVCRFIILSISVQTKKGMSEDTTHRKPVLCLVTSFIRAAGDR